MSVINSTDYHRYEVDEISIEPIYDIAAPEPYLRILKQMGMK